MKLSSTAPLATALLAAALTFACNKGTAPEKAAASEKEETGQAVVTDGVASFSVRVDAEGYHPGKLIAPPGKKISVVFTRVSDKGCADEVVFPTLDVRKKLPLNEAVTVEFPMPSSGSVAFTCGMGMLKGSVVAQ